MILVFCREIHPVLFKYPQFWLILAKGDAQDCGRSQKIANYSSLFCDLIFRGFGRKWLVFEPGRITLTGPFLAGKTPFYRLEDGEREKGGFGGGVFWIRPMKIYNSDAHRGSAPCLVGKS